ncbi:ZinT/AdcA family metal-binding protein [Erwinia sp. CPCC 100877]|nr:ZinT/AdcA family metal-binding protein [Erwinia sp. CPCC 100877]
MKRSTVLGIVLFALLLLTGACSAKQEQTTSTTDEKKLKIVTSFYPMYDFTKNIVGDEGDVEVMVPAGTEAHDYEPSAKDIKKIQDADVFVYNNENMEVWVPSMKETFTAGKVHVIKATENMLLLAGSEEEHEHSADDQGHSHELDPHVWLAPSLAIQEVKEIRDQLIKAAPGKEQIFKANAETYLKKLEQLDEAYRTTLENADQKSFVTQHAAFGYLALEYNLKQVPIAGLSPSEEPSATRLAELKQFVKENNIQYIYFEENATDAIARTLAKEANVKLLVLNPLESLTNDQMKKGEDYISVMRENLKALSKTINSGKASALDDQPVEKEKTAANGYFEDKEIEDRPLSNWAGKWQSVYPYVQDGTFDQVFDYKAKLNKDKTSQAYKKYYEVGYKTDIQAIEITDSTITYTKTDGTRFSSKYTYAGYQILNYEAGNHGVRYCFEAVDPAGGAFKYIQFSDHTITDTKVEHYHLYFGNESQEKLYSELENWPTYYPASLTGKEIAQEMLAH